MPQAQTWHRPPPQPPPRNCSHYVQFYSAEQALFDAIGGFVLPSFFSSEHAAVIVATQAHLDALEVYLRAQNLVPEMLKKREQLILRSAEDILEYLLENGAVDVARFHHLFEQLFTDLQKKYPRVLVYGELVNMLCEQGHHDMAYELEVEWELFLAGKDAELLCGYNLNAFASDGLEDVFQRICRAHSHIKPAESAEGSALSRPEDHQLVVAMLQQKTIRLEAEMAHRSATELALQEIVDHIGRRATEAVGMRDQDCGKRQTEIQPIGICATTHIEGSLKYFYNKKFLELSGLTEDQVINSRDGWLQAVHCQDRERVIHNLRFSDGKTRKCEYRFLHPNGEQRRISSNSVSKAAAYVHTAIDTTEFRELRQSLPITVGMLPEDRSHSNPFRAPSIASESDLCARLSLPMSPSSTTTLSTRSMSNHDQTVSHELLKMTKFAWGLLQSEHAVSTASSYFPPQTPPSSCSAPSYHKDSSQLLANLQTWYDGLPSFFVPSKLEFQSANDAEQKANIRLIYIAYLLSILLLTRQAVIEKHDVSCDSPLYDEDKGARMRSKCLHAAWEIICSLRALLSEPSNDEETRVLQGSRLAINSFLCGTVTFHACSTVSASSPSPEQNEMINTTLSLFLRNPNSKPLACRYAPLISSPPPQDTDYIALLKRPFCSAVFDPSLWTASDLLNVPAAMTGETTRRKRARQSSVSSVGNTGNWALVQTQREPSPGAMRARSRAKMDTQEAGVSKELEALFQVRN